MRPRTGTDGTLERAKRCASEIRADGPGPTAAPSIEPPSFCSDLPASRFLFPLPGLRS